MAVSFPTNPTNGQTFTSGNKTWTYNGRGWSSSSTSSSSTSTVDTATIKRINYGLNILLGR